MTISAQVRTRTGRIWLSLLLASPFKTEHANRNGSRNPFRAGRGLLANDYASLLVEVKERVRAAQYAALKAVNKELVALYWDIGRMIMQRQTDAAHGDGIVEQLAADLQSEFPGVSGYSRRNIFYMREFYLAYRDAPKVQPLVAQIGWTHNLTVLQRCKDPMEREFYIRMTKK